MKQIRHIEMDYEGGLNFGDRLAPYNYYDTWVSYKGKGIILPSYDKLHLIGDIERLWCLPRMITQTVVFKDGSWIQYRFHAGFIWDKISNPVGRDNTLESLDDALPHDANFSLKFLRLPEDPDNNQSFRDTNKLFYRMMRCKYIVVNGNRQRNTKEKLWRAIRNYVAVNGVIGRGIYENKAGDRAFWHRQTVEFTCSSPGCWR